jgi:Tol biopolymer transport system component
MSSLKYVLISLLFLIFISCGGSSKTSTETEDMTLSEEESSLRISELIENIEDDPNNLDWRLQLAREYEALDRNMEALKTYEEALTIDPNQADIKFSYAELALRMGDKRKSFQAYKDILLGMDGQQYLNRIAPKFLDSYNVLPVISSPSPEAYANYSPDGTKIIYQAYNNDNWDIFEYDIALQTTKQLTFDPSHEENPAYSPNMRTIVYTSTKDDHRNVDYNQKLRDIYTMDLLSQTETNLTTNSSNDWKPRYDRSSNFIVFVSERSDLREVEITELYSHIYIMEGDGSFQLQLTKVDANDGGPVLSGGETGTIYFDSNRNGSFEIYRMKADGSDLKQLTYDQSINNVAPDLNPVASKIAFFSDRDGNYEIYTMNENGDNVQRVTSNPADDVNPVFSLDGTKLLFHSDRMGNYDIFEADLTMRNEAATISDVVAKIDASISTL